MKINLPKISFIFLILLIIGATVFIVTSDFAMATPIADILVKVGKIIATVEDRVCPAATLLFFVASILLAFLTVSSLILNWTAGIGMYIGPDSLGYVFIDVGHTWVLGMVNMFFVIAFVFAALLYILDVEWGIIDKKTLPRLIIVALLINFSLLFTQLIVDFFIIFERGVVSYLLPKGLTPMLEGIRTQFFISWTSLALLPFISFIVLEVITAIIGVFKIGVAPLVLTIVQATTVVATVTPYIIQIISSFLLFIVFIVYAILFIARSVAIYILAMLAPLAIACTVFPKTRSYFDSWLKQLLMWGAMGIIIFFVLSFGFRMREIIAESPLVGGFEIDIIGRIIMMFIANFFFAIYALISLFMIKKFLPSAAQGVVGVLQKGAGIAVAAAGGMVAGAALMKYGGAAEKALSGMAKGHETSFVGRLATGTGAKIKKAREKRLAEESAAYDGLEEDTRIDLIKKEYKKGNKDQVQLLFRSGRNKGQDFTAEKLKKMGFEKDGKVDYEAIKEGVGEDNFYKEDCYKHLRYNEKIQGGTNNLKKRERFDELHKQGGPSLIGNDLTEYLNLRKELATKMGVKDEEKVSSNIGDEIKKQKEKNQQDIVKIAQDIDTKTMRLLFQEGELTGEQKEQLQDIVSDVRKGDISLTYAACGNNIDNIKGLIQRKIGKCKDEQEVIKCIGKYQELFTTYATSAENATTAPSVSLINLVVDGNATSRQKSALLNELKKDKFIIPKA